MTGLVVVISVVALAVLGLIWWWVVQPHASHVATARDVPLPLFTTRTPGRGVRIARPNLGRVVSAVPPRPPVEEAAAAAPVGAVTSTEHAPLSPPAPRPTDPPAHDSRSQVATVPGSSPLQTEPGRATPSEPSAAPSREPGVVTSNGPRNGATTPTGGNGRVPPAPPAVTPSRTFETLAASDAEARTNHPPQTATEGNGAAAERWSRPASPSPSGTIEFLPGRLEVVHGGRAMSGQEVRFVRPDRPDERAVVTFGRSEGPPYRHVQLRVPTVSRLHARMSLEPGSGTWKLENLSTTNPVAVNGVDLPHGAPALVLSDGDRVEMGEIVFTYRAR